jgi:hypothetical protein
MSPPQLLGQVITGVIASGGCVFGVVRPLQAERPGEPIVRPSYV